jgi:hypothetical protein
MRDRSLDAQMRNFMVDYAKYSRRKSRAYYKKWEKEENIKPTVLKVSQLRRLKESTPDSDRE